MLDAEGLMQKIDGHQTGQLQKGKYIKEVTMGTRGSQATSGEQ